MVAEEVSGWWWVETEKENVTTLFGKWRREQGAEDMECAAQGVN